MRYRWTRRLGILVGLVALAATPLAGQEESQAETPRHERRHADGDRRGRDHERKIEHLREALDLTEAQVAQVRSIITEQGEKRRALKESEDREGLEALHQETHDRLLAILDETQRAKLEEMRDRHDAGHRRGGEKRGDGEGRGHGQRDASET